VTRIVNSDPRRLEPGALFRFRHVPEVAEAFNALRLAEACDTLTRRLRLTDSSPCEETMRAFLRSYARLWRIVQDLEADALRESLEASTDPDAAILLARITPDLTAAHRAINAVLATRLSTRTASRSMHNAMAWLRGSDRGEGGLLFCFRQIDKSPVPAGWAAMLPWADIPNVESTLEAAYRAVQNRDTGHPAINAYHAYLQALEAPKRPEPKKRGPRVKGLSPEERRARRNAYMRDYMKSRRAAANPTKVNRNAERRAADQAAIDAAKAAYAAQLSTALSMPPAEIDPLS
jgi:hypothetical protein